MTEAFTEGQRAEMRAAIFCAVEEGIIRRRRENAVKRRLRRFNCTLRWQRDGYVVVDRYSALVELHGASIEQAEAWAAARLESRKACTS